MDLLSNVSINNHDPDNHSVILSLGQNLKNHDNAVIDETDDEVQTNIPEKKPIKTILVIDDEEPVRKVFKAALEKFGYRVMVAADGNEAMALFREKQADLIITDLFMPKKDGHAFIVEILQEFPGTKVFAITGKYTIMGIETELDIAKSLGALRGFTKPVKLSDLLDAIKEL